MFFAVDALYGSYVLQVGVFGIAQVMQNGTGGYNGIGHLIYPKTFQADGAKMFEQGFSRIVFMKNPFIQCVGIKLAAKYFFKMLLLLPYKKRLT